MHSRITTKYKIFVEDQDTKKSLLIQIIRVLMENSRLISIQIRIG